MEAKNKLKTNWSSEELKAYTYIYCMDADMKRDEEELTLIKKLVKEDTFNKMDKEFGSDKDYEVIQKIRNTIEDLNYSKNQITSLFKNIKDVFYADSNFSILERNLSLGLKRILDY